MPLLAANLAEYLPALTRRRLARCPDAIGAPEAACFPAAALLADVSGFSSLAGRLEESGPEGAEQLWAILNAYFERLISLVADHGGDIVNLAGDALVALWYAPEPEGAALDELALRAARCAVEIQEALNACIAAPDVELFLRIGLGAGPVLAMQVGGAREHWETVVVGPAVEQMSAALRDASPGDVVLSPEAWERVRGSCRGVLLYGGGMRLERVGAAAPVRALEELEPGPAAEAALAGLVPDVVRARLAAGLGGWLAELRRVSVLFFDLSALDYGAEDALGRTQAAVRALQEELERFEGTLNKISVDDKGVVAVAALGLTLAHEDDPVRAVLAAEAVLRRLREQGVRAAAGVATGRVFCGAVGSRRRRDYTMLGDSVNLAARLMQAARGGVLCDEATRQAAAARLRFESLPPVDVKGRSEPVPVYAPRGQADRAGSWGRTMVGRREERARLRERLERLRDGAGGVAIIEGEAGIGKSRLLFDLVEQARELGLPCLVGAGDAVEKTSLYHAWRHIFLRLLYLDEAGEAEERRAAVLEQWERDPELLRLAPLINDVLPVDLPETDVTRQMTGQVRADNTHALLVRLLERTSAQSPLIVAMEDAHWLDSASWALCVLVSRRVRSVLLVLATRPLGSVPPEYRMLQETPDACLLPLSSLPDEDLLALVAQRLGVARLPEAVSGLIRAKAQGNPFYGEELAYALRDKGLVLLTGGECRITEGVDLAQVPFPDSVQGIVTQRVDRLPPPQQLLLKAASVIGRIFPYRILHDIYPVHGERVYLREHLDSLSRLDLARLETPDPELAYLFKHIITQEAVYGLMLFRQRRDLHRAVAEWYERTQTDDLAALYPLLAFHWSQAGERARAVDYLEKAGEQAQRSGSYLEAAGFFKDALAMETEGAADGAAGPGAGRERVARWERQLGDAYLSLGREAESREHLERAVALMGYPVPASRARQVSAVLAEAGRQLRFRNAPARAAGAGETAPAEACRAYENLMLVYYFGHDTLLTTYASLRMLNLAELAGPSPELARAYATMGFSLGLVPLHSQAEAYLRRAYATAESLSHLPALAWVCQLDAVYACGIGQWERAHRALDRCLEIYRWLGDQRRWMECICLLSSVEHFEGRLTRPNTPGAEVYALASQTGNLQGQAWGLLDQAETALALGRFEAAMEFLQPLGKLFESDRVGHGEKLWGHGLTALAHLRLGDLDAARASADTAARLIAEVPPTEAYIMEGYANVAEVYLTLWERAAAAKAPAEDLRKRALRACAGLRKFAGLFPIAGPRAQLWTGWAAWLDGRTARATGAWERALQAAEKVRMPYEAALAHLMLGRHLPRNAPERRAHLEQAREGFSRLGAVGDAERARAA